MGCVLEAGSAVSASHVPPVVTGSSVTSEKGRVGVTSESGKEVVLGRVPLQCRPSDCSGRSRWWTLRRDRQRRKWGNFYLLGVSPTRT